MAQEVHLVTVGSPELAGGLGQKGVPEGLFTVAAVFSGPDAGLWRLLGGEGGGGRGEGGGGDGG